jgi:hypothetical protein
MPNEDDDEPRERFQISAGQVAASSLAAVSAAVVCSFFGVAGTVIGTAIASLVATVGSALYSYSLRRTRARLRRLHRAGAAAPPLREVWRTARQHGRRAFDRVEWAAVAIGTGAVFVFSIGVVSAIEGAEGESLSALFGVSHGGSETTSLGSLVQHGHHRHRSPAPSPTASPSTSPSPSASPSASPSKSSGSTASPSPTASSTVSPSPSASSSPSASPSASSSPSPSDSPPGQTPSG